MRETIWNFIREEDGVAVADMTLLMAALCGLALAVGTQVSNGMEVLSGELEATVVAQDASAAW